MDPNTVDPRALIDLGTEVVKTAPALLDRLGPMLGILYSPIDIVRTAKAEAQAQIIRAEASEKVASIKQRAKFRLQYEAVREQQNLEQAVKESLRLLSENAQPDKLDEDWLMRWTNEVKMISDPAVRMIWAKILAGEANQPGSYSLKTFDCLKSLPKPMLKSFSTLLMHHSAKEGSSGCRLNIQGGWSSSVISILPTSPIWERSDCCKQPHLV
jgi:hypothetical protein